MKGKKNKNNIFKAGTLFFAFVILGVCLYPTFLAPAKIQAQDTACIASGLADYISQVFDEFGTRGSGNVKFLSPVFNMTDPKFSSFATQLDEALAEKGYEEGLGSFYLVAGNAYNTSGKRITTWVDEAPAVVKKRNIILTEIGWYPHLVGDRKRVINKLAQEINKFPEKNIEGGLIFNVFGHNDDFKEQSMSDEELNLLFSKCSSSRVGANSAAYYYHEDLYSKADGYGMDYSLEIGNAMEITGSVKQGIEDATGRGVTPIVRIGVGDDSGGFDDPQALIDAINTINSYAASDVYVIIGPNEPLIENWATPECESRSSEDEMGTDWPEDAGNFYVLQDGQIGLIHEVERKVVNAVDHDDFPDASQIPEEGEPYPTSEGWQLPIYSPTVLSSDAGDHLRRGSVNAWDLTAECGRAIHAALDGTVDISSCNNSGGYGCWVRIQHGGIESDAAWSTYYAHMIKGSFTVAPGQKVKTGDPIGRVGCTGTTSFGPHLHFEVRKNGWPVDPEGVFGTPSSLGLSENDFCYRGGCSPTACDPRYNECPCTGDPAGHCW